MDTDTRVLDAYINQCTAEAQEGTRLIKKVLSRKILNSAIG